MVIAIDIRSDLCLIAKEGQVPLELMVFRYQNPGHHANYDILRSFNSKRI